MATRATGGAGATSFAGAWETPAGRTLQLPAATAMYMLGQVPVNAKVNASANTVTFTGGQATFMAGTGLATAPSTNTFTVLGRVNPTISVPAGSTVRILVINGDSRAPHSLVVTAKGPPYPGAPTLRNMPAAFPGANTPSPAKGMPPVKNGRYTTQVIQFKVGDKPGTYWYVCYYPGHAAAGMYGKLLVVPATKKGS